MSEALADRIHVAYPRLTPQEQRVADFLRDRPAESALYNSSELARLTGVSKATVSRLYRALGFADSREARESLRAERGQGVPVLVDEPRDRLAAHLERDIANLRRCYAGIDAQDLAVCASAIAHAARVVVVGYRSGFPIALHLRQQLAQARDDVRLVPEPGQSIAEELVGLEAADVVVLVGLRRRPAVFDATLARLVASPARVVVLHDPSLRPLGADWRFEAPIGSASAFDSHVAAAGVVGVLAGAVFEALGDAAAVRAMDVARGYRALGELAR